ncbi:MAG: hypothetical protein PHV59_12480 [Victivallales bacterium]|nr:hypothetical protein [Victivallales bacterium]
MMYKTWMKDKIIRLRWKKAYKEASNHVAIGKVLHENSGYLVMKCKTFHFQRILGGSRSGILEGSIGVRLIPWSSIEVMHELKADTEFDVPLSQDEKGNIILMNKYKTLIARVQDFGE